jgi:vacuolar protein sorting-associated protein 13A/C
MMSIMDLLSKPGASKLSENGPLNQNFERAKPETLPNVDSNEPDSFYDAAESLENTSSAGIIDAPDKVLLRFSFEVSNVSVALQRLDLDHKEKTLAILGISGFDLQYRQRPHDMGVQIQILAISVEDKLQPGQPGDNAFEFLLKPSLSEDMKPGTPLLLVEYLSLKPTSPDYQGIDQSVDISFASIDCNLVKESVLYLYDFVLKTFTSGPRPAPAQINPLGIEKSQMTDIQSPQNTMTIRMRMTAIKFIICQQGVKVASAKFGAGQLSITLNRDKLSVAGRLGNLSIVDEVKRDNVSETFRQLLFIEDSEVADFTYDTFNESDPSYPGYDSALKLRTSSVHMTFNKPVLTDLMKYFGEFQQLYNFLDSARRAAVEATETKGRFHYDLVIQTPIITFPDPSRSSEETITMYLGKISMNNSFRPSDESVIDEVHTVVKALKLVSNLNGHITKKVEQMIEDVDLQLRTVSCSTIPSKYCPQSSVSYVYSLP